MLYTDPNIKRHVFVELLPTVIKETETSQSIYMSKNNICKDGEIVIKLVIKVDIYCQTTVIIITESK